MLKPRDIANVQFRTAWRGYNEADVDEFVHKMVGAYETLYHEYRKLQEEAEQLNARVEGYSQTQSRIDEQIEMAKQFARDTRARAEKEAETILMRARLDAEDIVREARRQAEEYTARALETARHEAAFRARLTELLDDYRALLEQGHSQARALAAAVTELADEAAATVDGGDYVEPVEGGYDVDLGPDITVDEPLDVDRDWASTATADDIDMEPTRRMDAIRPRRTEA